MLWPLQTTILHLYKALVVYIACYRRGRKRNGKEKKWKLTLYPQALSDPILLEQEQKQKEEKTVIINL